jgi:hypothetical protein
MFRESLEGMLSWNINNHLWINYIDPLKCEPILSDLHEQTIIVIDGHGHVFKGDFRKSLLKTEGDWDKLLEWYQYNVWYDEQCVGKSKKHADILVSSFYHRIKKCLPKKRKKKKH